MPAIIEEPLNEIVPAYRPIVYRFSTQVPSTTFSAKLEVEIYVNGTLLDTDLTKRYDPKEILDDGTNTTYIYEIDLAEPIQNFFDNDQAFWELGSKLSRKGDDLLPEVYFTAYDWLPDADGFLVKDPTGINSQLIHVINAYRRAGQVNNIREHYTVDGIPFKWLTEKPNRVLIGLEDNEFISAISDGVYSLEIKSYDSDGNLIDRGYFSSATILFTEITLIQFAVGPANINAIDPADWDWGSVTIDDSVKFYTIQGGVGCPLGQFTPVTEIRRYYLFDTSCRTYRFHFLNNFGQHETVDIYNNQLETYTIKSRLYETALPAVYTPQDRGLNRQSATGQTAIKATAQNLSPEEVAWLRIFLLSNSAYLERDGGYISIVIDDTEFESANDTRALQSVPFSLKYAQVDTAQRN